MRKPNLSHICTHDFAVKDMKYKKVKSFYRFINHCGHTFVMVSQERPSLPASAQEGEAAVRLLSCHHGLNKDHPTPPPASSEMCS